MTGRTPRAAKQERDASYGVDWDAERIEIINLEEENNFRFDAYNAGVRWGTDGEIMATRLNMKEERVLIKNLRKINIERLYCSKVHDIKRSLMEQRSHRFRHHTASVKSNLSANEVARFRRLDLQGKLFPPGSKDRPVTSCGFNSSHILANAARRLFGSSASPRRNRPMSAAPTVSEVEVEPSMTETTAHRQVHSEGGVTAAIPISRPRPLTAVFPSKDAVPEAKSARTQSAPIRATYSARSAGHFTSRERDHEGLDFAAIEELLPRGVRLPTGSTEEKIAALRELLRRSRMAQERAKRQRLERKIRELCKVFDGMAMRPEATEIFIPEAVTEATTRSVVARKAWQGD